MDSSPVIHHHSDSKDPAASHTRPRCFFDITIDGVPHGRIVFELYDEVAPKTAENFRALCTGEKTKPGWMTGRRLHYRGSRFFKVIPNLACYGGDLEHDNGTGGESVYGGVFPTESFRLSHSAPGMLSMAASPCSHLHTEHPGLVDSKFLITLKRAPHLDGQHVVFGGVVEGLDTLRAVERAGSLSGFVRRDVRIEDCGQLELVQGLFSSSHKKRDVVLVANEKAKKLESKVPKVENEVEKIQVTADAACNAAHKDCVERSMWMPSALRFWFW